MFGQTSYETQNEQDNARLATHRPAKPTADKCQISRRAECTDLLTHSNVIYDISATHAVAVPLSLRRDLNGSPASLIHIHTDSAYMTTACPVEGSLPSPSATSFILQPIPLSSESYYTFLLALLRY